MVWVKGLIMCEDEVPLSLFGRVVEECLYIIFVVVEYVLLPGN